MDRLQENNLKRGYIVGPSSEYEMVGPLLMTRFAAFFERAREEVGGGQKIYIFPAFVRHSYPWRVWPSIAKCPLLCQYRLDAITLFVSSQISGRRMRG